MLEEDHCSPFPQFLIYHFMGMFLAFKYMTLSIFRMIPLGTIVLEEYCLIALK